MGQKADFTYERREMFIEFLFKDVDLLQVCKAVGISYQTYAKHKANDETFRMQVEAALDSQADRVEKAMLEKAASGDVKAADLILKAMKPDKYRKADKVIVDTGALDKLRDAKQDGNSGHPLDDAEDVAE